MIRLSGYKTKFIPITHKYNKTTINFDYTFIDEIDGKERGTWMSHTFSGLVWPQMIKDFIIEYINKQVTSNIQSKFIWNDKRVWLSLENQMNYKNIYDLAIQTGGQNLPVKVKLGTVENPVYHTFTEVEDIYDFYLKMTKHIEEQLNIGWSKKDSINWEDYKLDYGNTI